MNEIDADSHPPRASIGRRWALFLAGALLIVTGASAAVRWADSAAAREEIRPMPVPNSPSPTREQPTAPDPGDNP